MAARPENIGILALELYVPPSYVAQKELEVHDGVSAGKYTIGLGQENLGFCGDNEDVISMSLTVTQQLMERNGVDPRQVGRLEVGTETVMDKSKSIKSVLMTLFEPAGNADIEGADSTNACYGGTAALLNCINWVDSSSWDGRYAICVCADVAVYAAGPARPTGGAGAVALLIGPDAPLAFEPGLTGTYASHVYDFYKPKPACEYPVVDGKLSQTCYIRALDECYLAYARKFIKRQGKPFSLQHVDHIVLHSPYNKLVQKGTARLVFDDAKASMGVEYLDEKALGVLEPFFHLDYEKSLVDRDLEKAALGVASELYRTKVAPGTVVGRNVGNMYAASLYSALASAVAGKESPVQDGQRILLFSYGSGLISSMFSFRVRSPARSAGSTILKLQEWLDLDSVLNSRVQVSPKEFVETMELAETRYGACDYVPKTANDRLQAGVFYLSKVDSLYRRYYEKKTCSASLVNGSA